MRRIAFSALAAVVAGAVAGTASAGVALRAPDTADYPHVVVSVVTSSPTTFAPRLWENGRPAPGVDADNLGRARSIVLAIDRSRSMEGKPFADAVAAARSFVARKRAGDRLAIVGFGSRAEQLSRPSTATIDADGTLRTLAVDDREGTALYDGIVLASRAVAAEALPAKIVVVLTDGRDVSSRATAAAAADAARRAGVALYAIGIESKQFSGGVLRRLAAATGGRYFAASSSSAVAAAYARLGAELSRTWRLSYVTAARPGDRLRLAATVPGLGSSTATVVVPGSTPPVEGSALPGWLVGTVFGTFLLALFVAAVVLAAFVLIVRARDADRLRRRLAPHVEQRARAQRSRDRFAAGSTLFRVTERAFSQLRGWRRVERLLQRADVPLRTVEFLYIVGGGALFAGLVAALAGRSTLTILGAFVVGGAIPYTFVWFKARQRLKAFENQLPDLLLTLAASLKAGHSFKHGLQVVVDEGHPPASREFQRVLAETRLGRAMDDALAEMCDRVGSKNLEFVVTAVTIQSQVGGSLAGLFDMVAEAVRQRQQFARKIRGLTAMGRASAYVLVGIPFFIAVAITMLNPEYMDPLYHTSTGKTLIAIGLVMMAVGSVLLKKIVSFRG